MDQKTALGILLSGKNAFITGAAGSGKTFLLNEFMRRAKKSGKRVAKTASTGIAATLLNGNTIHSWSGIGLRDHLTPKFFDSMPKSRREAITRADILVIDEISMVKDWFLDLVNEICQIVRISTKPFGGLQVIFSGDFAQLPPINTEYNKEGNFAYLSKAWQEADPVICYLNTQFRQEDNGDFAEILNAIRTGTYRRHHIEKILARRGAELPGKVTQLHTMNRNVDGVNLKHLSDILEEEHTFHATFTGRESHIENLKKSVLAPEVLTLKKGATVMALKNDQSKQFVNGSIGEIIDFDSALKCPIVKFNNGRTVTVVPDVWERRDDNIKLASMSQIPLKLAWAITVHKSQGMTLDAAVVNLSYTFAPGMGYVALSRVKSLDSLSLVGLSKSAVLVSEEAIKMNQIWEKAAAEAAKEYAHLKTPLQETKKSTPKKSKPSACEITDNVKKSSWQERIVKMREVYPKAYCEWTEEDDLELQDLFLSGNSVGDIVEATGRHPGAVRARLKKNYGEELFAAGFPS